MAYLYINSKGNPWRKHSYSAGNTFDQSPYKYYLQKVLGWKERDNKARFMFGKALEEAVQYHHEHDGVGAKEDFIQRWAVHKEDGNLSYTDVEKNWQTLNQMGTDMIRLYVAMQPKLPIPMGGRSVFQREYAKEVFQGLTGSKSMGCIARSSWTLRHQQLIFQSSRAYRLMMLSYEDIVGYQVSGTLDWFGLLRKGSGIKRDTPLPFLMPWDRLNRAMRASLQESKKTTHG